MASNSLRLAIDIGGTFTDTVLADPKGRILSSAKTLTTHESPVIGAMEGARRTLDDIGKTLSEVSGFVHGTTLATNALIERRGARVATITTKGFRDILEIAYERRYDQYDINLQKPDLLVPRDLSFTVQERMAVDGTVLIQLEEVHITELIAELQANQVDALAICLLHAYANPAHEQRLRDVIGTALPNLSISLSSEVSPEAREFDRLCTTVANAYVQPMLDRYLSEFKYLFEAEGLCCPILMMTASGGMCTVQTARSFPIRLVESGPAGGAILAAKIARQAALDHVLSFDMGGTTAKLCLIDAARPQTSRQFEIARAARFIKGSGMPVRIPVIDMIEIGAGGGSIAAVDRLGRLSVGPESAGSNPGPAAFGRGGKHPTVTDADVQLRYIRPEGFAEGQFQLQPQAATAAIERDVGSKLELSANDAADGISRIVDENMASAARMHAVESGKDLGARTMIAFGGNGPLHATRIARSAGVSRILIPPNPSVGSAVGFLHAPISYEIVRSRYAILAKLDLDGLNDFFDGLISEARSVVKLGTSNPTLVVRRSAFMRYHGQGHEIEITLPDRALLASDLATLTTLFEDRYQQQFSRPVPGMAIEVLNWAVKVSTVPTELSSSDTVERLRPTRGRHHETIICDITGEPISAVIVERADLQPGDEIEGPALVTEPQTTTLISADFGCTVDGASNLILTRKQREVSS